MEADRAHKIDRETSDLRRENTDLRGENTGMRQGEKIGKYIVIDEIGKGTSGTVYRVRDLNSGLHYAMKCFECISRGEREAQMLKILRHPGIPRLADCFIHDEKYFLVMEYEEGISLKELIQKNRMHDQGAIRQQGANLQWGTNRQATEIFTKLVEIVSYLHSRPVPIVHGDLKPENIYLTKEGEVKLLDFGSAARFSNRKQARESTPGYAAPEMYLGICLRESDVYALGYILVYIISGKGPETTNRRPTAATLRRLGLSAPLAEIACRCIRRNPKDRYASAQILSERLKGADRRHRLKRLAGKIRSIVLTDGGGILSFYGLYTISYRVSGKVQSGKLCLLAGCVFLIAEILAESYNRKRFGEECTRIYSLFLAG